MAFFVPCRAQTRGRYSKAPESGYQPLAFSRFNSIVRTHLKLEGEWLTAPVLPPRRYFKVLFSLKMHIRRDRARPVQVKWFFSSSFYLLRIILRVLCGRQHTPTAEVSRNG
jgi:hypothetical protein